MPALEPLGIQAEITWIGRTEDRSASLRSVPLETAVLSFEGLEGEDHGDLTRASCSRVRDLYPVGTEIRNARQLSIVSQEELDAIAMAMGIRHLDPADIGASIVVRGIPDFTYLPPSSRLQTPSGATFTVDMENRSCQLPAVPLEGSHPGKGGLFKSAALNRRGIVAWVERPGPIAVGDSLKLFVPAQRRWEGAP